MKETAFDAVRTRGPMIKSTVWTADVCPCNFVACFHGTDTSHSNEIVSSPEKDWLFQNESAKKTKLLKKWGANVYWFLEL